ncbi:MAG TPA: hypothetical protein VN493_20605 [Thermoanaerobaculia bacterium]|nr:hypothetical protein [Thermoanaerobaculia bacterium]
MYGTPLSPAYDLEGPGLAIAQAGIGLQGWKKEVRKITLDIRAPVELALLYWTGRDHPCSPDPETGVCGIPEEPYRDQLLQLDGALITGTIAGTELQPDSSRGPVLNIGYVADVTDAVRARGTGRQSFPISDGDPRSNLTDLDGAGLLVVTSDPGRPPARVLVFQGLDFAYGEDRTPGPSQITEAITFNHGAARSGRTGALALFVGDDGKGPDRIDISHNPDLVDRIDGSAGARWDADRYPVQVPGGTLATTVRLASEPWGQNPDSLLWVMAALWLPSPVPTGCATSYWHADQEQWKFSGVPPTQKIRFIFPAGTLYGDVGEATLRTALRFQDQPGLLGAAKTLVKQGGAALLNSAHLKIEYPLTRTLVLTRVNETLRNRDEAAIRALAGELKEANEAGCPLK